MTKKFVKVVRERLPWIHSLIDECNAREFDLRIDRLRFHALTDVRCLACKGAHALCGKPYCLALVKLQAHLRFVESIKVNELHGSSPPSLFVGRMGYPYVHAGPAIPLELGDTSLYDFPEFWLNHSLQEILSFRLGLFRGKLLINLKKPRGLESLQELAMSKLSVELQAEFKGRPRGLLIDAHVQPYGFAIPLKRFSIGSTKIPQSALKYYEANDVKAKEALWELYRHGFPVSYLQRILSAACLGSKLERRLVPTRWSITAIDALISQRLREEVKRYSELSDYRVFETEHGCRKFVVILIPSAWSYELIEAWYPRTVWNEGEGIAVCCDWEGYFGKQEYACIGGCYYAARLACLEYLQRIRKQAACIVISESYPGYLPTGVWHVRELVRQALASKGIRCSTLKEALEVASFKLRVQLKQLLKYSYVFKQIFAQQKLNAFL